MTDIKPKRIKLAIESNEYQRLLKRGEESVSMHSGLVTLEPGNSVGEHTTRDCEEMIIVLKGSGEMNFNLHEKLAMEEGYVLYCPPNTEHNVKNTGEKLLKYIYITAKTIKE
jgi:mannose-6-phosphate isomerase-like protein (cupin superfamily)